MHALANWIQVGLPGTSQGNVKSPGVSRVTVTLAASLLVAVIGWADYATGDYSMTVFYLVPVGLATWYAGRGSGWLVGLLSAAAWLVGDLVLGYHSHHLLEPVWNAAMPALIYGVGVELLFSRRRLQSELEDRVRQRTASLAQANQELEAARLHFIEIDKLESIGRLAAGVAHEVKNPLMTITMVVDFLSDVAPVGDPDGRAMLESLREAVERANRVVSEMLEFARPAPLSLRLDDFHLVAERALALVKHERVRKHLGLVCDWCEGAPFFPFDRNKIEQVLVNLLLNAIQATPDGGSLKLRSRIRASEFIIEIDDTGTGISPGHQAKLFEPFFTTKPVGQGTGLGLSVARQIVQLHGGKLYLANRPEGGARVTIQLPVRTKV